MSNSLSLMSRVWIWQIVKQLKINIVVFVPFTSRIHPVWVHVFWLEQRVRHLRLVDSQLYLVRGVKLELKVVLVALELRVLSRRLCTLVALVHIS